MKNTKGLLLAGGTGSRLYPSTTSISKHLLAIYDKPMIYYSLSILMLSKIRDIAIIVNESDLSHFQNLLGNGSDFGLNLNYIIQNQPRGIADAFIIAEDYIHNSPCSLVLGDNLFFGPGFTKILLKCKRQNNGSTSICYPVKDPAQYGILYLDKHGKPKKIIEKPKQSNSNLAVTGIYFFDKNVSSYAKTLKPSYRGELEVTDLLNLYIKKGKYKFNTLGRGFAWLDTGSHKRLLEASKFVEAVQSNQGYMIACLEEIALNNKWISSKKLYTNYKKFKSSSYGKYLKSLIKK